MNLVIDDAVEVKLAHKEQEEARRSLGELHRQDSSIQAILIIDRPNIAQGRQRFAHSSTAMMNLPREPTSINMNVRDL
jgi:hypothetical protein